MDLAGAADFVSDSRRGADHQIPLVIEEGESQVNEKTEAEISILAAMFVLFSAMLDPRVSVALSVIFLVALAFYKLTRPARQI